MLDLAFAVLCAAVAIGAGLALATLREVQAKPPHRAISFVHGILGAASLLVLIAALRQGPPRTGMGLSGFGVIGAGLLGIAFALGLALFAAGRHRRPAGALVGAHASVAIAAFVVLLSLVALSTSAPPVSQKGARTRDSTTERDMGMVGAVRSGFSRRTWLSLRPGIEPGMNSVHSGDRPSRSQ